MASPRQTQTSTTQPLTPPADLPSTNNASSQPNTTNASNSSVANPALIPATSLQDTGKSRRPRDARLIHMLLASLGVTAYQERVPLQLLDFAYRYASSTLQDAVHLSMEGYAGNTSAPGETVSMAGGRGGVELNTVTLPALRLSLASRLHYQFQPGLPKEFLVDIAAERNRIALPGASRGFEPAAGAGHGQGSFSSLLMGGIRLPPERFCLTGVAWNLKDEWESEGEEDIENTEPSQTVAAGPGLSASHADEEGDEGDDGDGKMEDIFGDDPVLGDDGGDDEDKTMIDV